MPDNSRRDMRTPITLKIKFKSANLDQFIERYSVDVSRGGIFIRTKEPLAVGTQLKFEFQLQDMSSLISGEGTVVWIREPDPARVGVAPGMGVRFDKLQPQSQQVLDKILAEKTKRGDAQVESRFDAGVRASASASGVLSSSPPPQANDRARAHNDFSGGDSKAQTPLPPAMPGMETNDEFSQESTRVMQDSIVQKLAAETRGGGDEFAEGEPTRKASAQQLEELAKVSADKPAEAPPKVEVAAETKVEKRSPAVEQNGEVAAPPPPAPVAVAEKKAEAAEKKAEVAEKKIEVVEKKVEPEPPAPAEKEAPKKAERYTPPVAAAPERPAQRSSALPMLFVLGLAAAAGGYWWYSGNINKEEPPPAQPVAEAPSAVEAKPAEPETPGEPENPGEPKAAEPANPAAAVAQPEEKPAEPAGPVVAVTSDPAGAQVFVDGQPHAAPTPTQLTGLDPAKVYEVKLSLKGFRDWKVKLKPKAGDKIDAALVPNEKVVAVASTPPGAEVFVDGKRVGRTPFEIKKLDLSKSHDIELKRPGFIAQSRTVSATDPFETKGDRDVLALAVTLEAEPKPERPAAAPAQPRPVSSPAALIRRAFFLRLSGKLY